MIDAILKWLRASPSPMDYRAGAGVFEKWIRDGEPAGDRAMREISTEGLRDRYSAGLTLAMLEVLGQYGGEDEVLYLQRLIDLPVRNEDQGRIRATARAILPAIEARAEAERERETLLRPASSESEGATTLLRPAADSPAETDKLLHPADPPQSGG